MEKIIDKDYLRSHPNHIFVFGDNTLRCGLGGAAALRNEPNTYGFITKIYPNNNDASFYTPDNYKHVFEKELNKLIEKIESNKNKKFLISKLGAGLANKYNIFDEVINPGIQDLKKYTNVSFLFS